VKTWFEILSELFVNLAAAWFALLLIEPQISELGPEPWLPLTLRFSLGIISLLIAKLLRELGRK